MKTIGLLGGMSWESTLVYYRDINLKINQSLGGLHSAPLVMVNVDFQPIEDLMRQDNWPAISQLLKQHINSLQQAGADCLVIATNTMHKLAPEIESTVELPLLHIADSVAKVLINHNIQSVGIIGTAFTMQESFYQDRLNQHGIKTTVPDIQDQHSIHQIIFQELCQGQFKAESKQTYLDVIDRLKQQGAQAVVLACTEIGLLVNQADTTVPLFDATEAHINDAVAFALHNS